MPACLLVAHVLVPTPGSLHITAMPSAPLVGKGWLQYNRAAVRTLTLPGRAATDLKYNSDYN